MPVTTDPPVGYRNVPTSALIDLSNAYQNEDPGSGVLAEAIQRVINRLP